MSPPQAIYLDEKSEEQVPLLPAHAEREPAPPPRDLRFKKAWRFLASAVFLWLAVRFLSDHLVSDFGAYNSKASSSSLVDWSIPPDVTPEECATWQGDVKPRGRGLGRAALYEPYTASASFALPIASDKLFLLARGQASGALKVRHGGDSENVEIDVVAHYQYEDALEGAQVCTLKRGEGEHGFGIFVPRWSRQPYIRHVGFEVTLVLPKGHDGAVLGVKDFTTDLPLFKHHIGDFHRHVHFDSISLGSSNSPIVVESLGAEKAQVATSNSPIEGTFNVSSSLRLETSNSHVNVNVNLYNDADAATTDLVLSTSNARLKATLQLESAQKTGGRFKIGADTSNAPIELAVSDAPVDSLLLLDAHTSIAPASVTLHKTFEGTFDIASSLKRPVVHWDHTAEDPAGKGRTRKVFLNSVGSSTFQGSARWSEGEEERIPGRVSVKTSLAPAVLKL